MATASKPKNADEYAVRLAATSSWWDAYDVLWQIPDTELDAVAHILQLRALDTIAVLAVAAARNDGIRIVGYLGIEENTPTAALSELITTAQARVHDPRCRVTLGCLLAELGAAASLLAPSIAIRALALYAAAADATRYPSVINGGLTFANTASIDHSDQPARDSHTATLHQLHDQLDLP